MRKVQVGYIFFCQLKKVSESQSKQLNTEKVKQNLGNCIKNYDYKHHTMVKEQVKKKNLIWSYLLYKENIIAQSNNSNSVIELHFGHPNYNYPQKGYYVLLFFARDASVCYLSHSHNCLMHVDRLDFKHLSQSSAWLYKWCLKKARSMLKGI